MKAIFFTVPLSLIILLASCSGHNQDDSGCPGPPQPNDIPFEYTLGTEQLLVTTPGGIIHVSIGPSGAHNGPHTGHAEGDSKANWVGLYATQWSDKTELSGDGDGICEEGETCGVAQSVIDNGIPTYIAPFDGFTVTEVLLNDLHPSGAYYGTDQHWKVTGGQCGYTYAIGHLREIAEDLRLAMINAGYTDPATVTTPGTNLITGSPVVLSKGESIARPQVVAEPVTGYPGYYDGKWAYEQTPWTQIEFFAYDTAGEASFYSWLDSTTQNNLQAMMYAEADNPLSFRYHYIYLVDWLWKSEMVLYTREVAIRENYNGIESHLGDWWESNGGTCGGGTDCDELFVIYPIFKSTPYYDAALYESADVSYLVHYRRKGEAISSGEVVSPSALDPVSGTMLIKWRTGNKSTVTPPYEPLSYRLSTGQKRLRIRWGTPVSTAGSAVYPAIPTDSDVCDGSTLTCHDHEYNAQNL